MEKFGRKKGKTLNAAIWEYCDQIYINEYEQINLEKYDFDNKLPDNNLQGVIGNFLQTFTEIDRRTKKKEAAFEKLLWNLLNKILSEKLIGLGVEAPVKSSDYPKIIPLHIWPHKINEINWDDSSISLNGVQFLNIRLIKELNIKKEISPSIPALPEIKIKDKKNGRPTHADKINDTYELLKKENKIDFKKPLIWNIELIRETILHSYPDLNGNPKGLGDDAISNKIAKQFNADKETYKPT